MAKMHGVIWKFPIFISLFIMVKCYPTNKKDAEVQPDEKTFPNGTVVGKYAYVDKEGNPVQVKYYADDSSYGVEMNSIKVIQAKDPAPTEKPSFTNTKPDAAVSSKEYDILDPFKYPIAPTNSRYKSTARQDITKLHHKTKYSKNPEYEVYTQNEINSPTKSCDDDKEKLLVYNIENEARKARALSFNDDEAPKYCDRFF